jgi:SAM-dependent methyltransferase
MPEYVDFAEYYDFDHAINIDIPFYLDFANHSQPPILELACGTGRVLIPLAMAGFEIYGIDISANMLEVCRHAVGQRHLDKQVHLSLADMASFDLPRKDFGLVLVALRSFMHLLSQVDQLAGLRRVYEHLHSEGSFILSLIAPDLEKLAQKPSDVFVVRREFDLPNGHHVMRKERLVEHDAGKQVRHFEFKFEEYDLAGRLVRERLIPVYTRYTLWTELQRLLESVGFQVVNVFRDYNKRPYDGTGEMIVVAQRSHKA